MAKLTSEDIERIIKEQMPGYRVVEHHAVEDAVAQRVTPTEGTADLAELQERVARQRAQTDNPGDTPHADNPGADEAPAEPLADDEEEDHMVVVAPEAPPTPWDHGSKAKVVIVSGRDGKIITSQG